MKHSILPFLLLFTVFSFGQQETIIDTISKNAPPNVKLIIRDPCSVNNDPLYIVDGRPVTAKEVKNINPEAIETVTVLKGTAATSLYGSKAVNGAIIIKTSRLSSLPMDGTYKIEFTNASVLKDGYITFDGTSFTMRNAIFPTQSGMLTYGKNIISITSEFSPDVVINFRTSDMGKDTINFEVNDKKVMPASYLYTSANRGRLIKVK